MKEKIKTVIMGIVVTLVIVIMVAGLVIGASLSNSKATLGTSDSNISRSEMATRELTRTIINMNTKRLK